ncbi:MAG: hypothetical protein ACN6NS_08060 [Acinetobacter johnsonii]
MNIGINDAIIVALVSAFSGFCVQYFFKWQERKHISKSFELSVLAEIDTMLKIIERRGYRNALESGIFTLTLTNKTLKLQIDIQENYCPIYYSNLDKISFLSKKKVKSIVRFYSILASLVQDVKPGGILNADHPSLEDYQDCLQLLDEVIELGNKVID